MATTAQAVATALKQAGVTRVFGHPGGEVVTLIEALRQAEIDVLLTRHETQGAFMACAIGELTQRPAVCMGTVGPGATNMLTGVAAATQERAPLLAITGDVPRKRQNLHTHQKLPLHEIYGAATKWSTAITSEQPRGTIAKAVSIACQERPGAVHLTLPSDVAGLPALDEPPALVSPPGRPLCDPELIAQAAVRLSAARRPAILAGLGARRGGAGRQLLALAHRLGAPVVTTPKAKGVIPEDDACSAGVVEMFGDQVLLDALAESDLLLAVGVDAIEYILPWTHKMPVVHLDRQPNGEGYYAAELEVVGEIAPALAALTEAVTGPDARWGQAPGKASRASVFEFLHQGDHGGLAPQQVIATVRRLLPPDTIATCDAGAHKMLATQLWTVPAGGAYLCPNGLSSMGYGLPASAGAKLVYPDRPVVALTGDGGLSMYLGELETLVRARLPVLVVVFVDEALSLIKVNQESRGLTPVAVDTAVTDYAAAARAMGAHGLEAETLAELEQALAKSQELLKTGKPVLLAVHVNPVWYRGRWRPGYGA